MIKILEEKDVSTLKEYVNDDIIRRLDDSRSFFPEIPACVHRLQSFPAEIREAAKLRQKGYLCFVQIHKWQCCRWK